MKTHLFVSSCELNFPSSTALIEHNQRCYKMEYKCNICSKRFKYEFGYNKHMDVEHRSRKGQNIAGSSAGGVNIGNTVLGKKHNVAAISPAKKGLYFMSIDPFLHQLLLTVPPQ